MDEIKIEAPLILLLGNYRPSLILARTFSKQGFDVAVGNHGCERLCQYSSAVSSIWNHSALDGDPERLAAELREYKDRHPQLIAIFPVAEEYVRLFAEHEKTFTDLPSIVSMDSKLVNKCLDKEFMLNLAQSNDVFTAPFANTTGLAQAIEAGNTSLNYPMIVRPRDSTQRIDGQKAVIVANENDLINCHNTLGDKRQELLLQSKFEGKRHNIYFAAIDGGATRLLHAVIDRTDKVDGTGLAVEGRTINTDNRLVTQTKKLLCALNYTGIGCAQFLVNDETGETSFLEINPRIAGNHALPEYAGLDLGWFNFARVVYKHLDGKHFSAAGGIRYCWTSGDLMGAKVAFLRGEIGFFALINWCAKSVLSAVRADLHMVFSFRDPYPAIQGLWNLVPRIARWKKPDVAPGENTIYSNDERRYS